MILAIDASWTATGLVVVPEDVVAPWMFAECRTVKTVKKKFENDAARLFHIVGELYKWAEQWKISGVYIEDFFTGIGVKPLGRLRGAIDLEIWRKMRLEVFPVNVSQARKLLLGPMKKTDRKQIKKIVLNRWQAAGAPVVDDAQADALTIANYGLYLRGKPCLKK